MKRLLFLAAMLLPTFVQAQQPTPTDQVQVTSNLTDNDIRAGIVAGFSDRPIIGKLRPIALLTRKNRAELMAGNVEGFKADLGGLLAPSPQKQCRIATMAVFGLEMSLAFGAPITPQMIAAAVAIQQQLCNPTPAPAPTPGKIPPLPSKRFQTGAIPTPHATVMKAPHHKLIGATPAQFACVPLKLSMFLNDRYGNCVTAEEFFAKAAFSCGPYATGPPQPELLASDTEVYNTSVADNGLNGQNLAPVMDFMIKTGASISGTRYYDGPYVAVDGTKRDLLCNAISIGPVKIGVAASVLQGTAGNRNGWYVTGARQDNNEDHCVALCGYGTATYLYQAMGLPLPAGLDGNTFGYLLFTWSSIGFIDEPSMLNITGEWWVRNPTTVVGVPVPVPTPTPTPRPHTFRAAKLLANALQTVADISADYKTASKARQDQVDAILKTQEANLSQIRKDLGLKPLQNAN